MDTLRPLVPTGVDVSLQRKASMLFKTVGTLFALGLMALAYSLIEYNMGFFSGVEDLRVIFTICMIIAFGFVSFAVALMYPLNSRVTRTVLGLCLGLLFLHLYWSITLHVYKELDERWMQEFVGSLFHPMTLPYSVHMDLGEGQLEDRLAAFLKYAGFITSGIIGTQGWFRAMLVGCFRRLFPTE